MHGEFDDEELDPVFRPSDTELTLGPKLLLGLGFGLVVLCALFFALGYAVGHHAPPPAAAAVPVTEKPKEVTQDNSKPKPSATTQGKAAKMVASSAETQAASSVPQATDKDVHVEQASTRAAAPSLQTGASPGALMVQIAAVSHQEDAEVLQGALRKRGYRVTAGRDAEDNLIHVRIGPFNSREEAGKWRQKLLGDGYNAIVQP